MASQGSMDETAVSDRRSAILAAVAMSTIALALLATALCGEAKAVPIHQFSTGNSSTQAGGHGDLKTSFIVGTRWTEPGVPCECNSMKNAVVHLPAGVVGNPHAVPRCTAAEFASWICPIDSQIGIGVVTLLGPDVTQGIVPVYNMVPGPNQPAAIGIVTPITYSPPVTLVLNPRTESDYGLDVTGSDLTELLPIYRSVLFLWGVPADPKHDALRFPRGPDVLKIGGYFPGGVACLSGDPTPEIELNAWPSGSCEGPYTPPIPSNSPPTPFISNPTTCVGPQTAMLDVTSYDLEFSHASSTFPAMTGCPLLSFDPSLTAAPTTKETDSPSGIDMTLTVPQFQSPTTPSPSHIRASRVTLPPGFTINTNAADGKLSCSDAAANFGSRDPGACPEHSKIGSISIASSALPGALPGYMYLGEPLPGNRYRVFLIADGFSLHVKIAGAAKPDPQTGQLTISFEDLPQSPFQEFKLHVFGAERGLLATPTQCGTYAVESEFVPWAAEVPNQTSTQYFTIDSGPAGSPCPPSVRPFAVDLEAGVTDNTGGVHTDFATELTRQDGDQNLTEISLTTPPGFSATLAGVPYCSEAALADVASVAAYGAAEMTTPRCPSGSQIGVASTEAGAGSAPVSLPGKVYLAGPYKGAPLSLAVVTPAVSGPYDLGNVVVRVALHVDAEDAHITAVSDPLPQIREGIPLRLRRILVLLNRPEFALNPTNCAPFAVGATVSGDQGGNSSPSSHFQVANCGALDFAPALNMTLTGGLRRRGHPAIHALFRPRHGEANTSKLSVTLPKGQLLDNAHINSICTRGQFAVDACPAGSRIGKVVAHTPLLDQPLTGGAYLRSSVNKLPDLVLDLEGQVDIEVVGLIDSLDARLRVTFDSVPDVPVSRVELDLLGGRKGLLINSASLCGTSKRATVKMTGQNGVTHRRKVELRAKCQGGVR